MKYLGLISNCIFVLLLVACAEKDTRSYMSIDHDCIKVDGTIKEAVNKTLQEFPECKVSSSGNFMDSEFIYVMCGNTPLIATNFLAIEDERACQIYANMDSLQKRRIIGAK